MTAKQREVWSLYAKGNTVSDIAQITGRSKSSVYSMLMRVCPFFDSCRDCTFAGCVLDKFREVVV